MANLNVLNFETLGNVYLVANTPSYLLRHYRNNQSVQSFAALHSASELAAEIERVSSLNLSTRTLEDIVAAYSAIVALTFKDTHEIDKAVEGLTFDHILWGERILFLWEPHPTVEATMTMEIVPGPPLAGQNTLSVVTRSC